MCRLLCVSEYKPFAISKYLQSFANLSKQSKEYQGHGWGCAWRENSEWRLYHSIKPIWEDDLRQFKNTTLLLVHARSAFRDEGIQIENNMPFHDGDTVFIFNGELRGVRIKEQGRIGAEKIFNYLKRFRQRDWLPALEKGTRIIGQRTRYVRAMNIIMADGHNVYLSTHFNEDPAYFQMHRKNTRSGWMICSEPFAGENDWRIIGNRTLERLPLCT